MSRIYTVRLVRPVFQQVTVEVQAWSQSSAVQKAIKQTRVLRQSDWNTPDFDDGEYEVHVQSIIDNQHIYENSADPHREIKQFRSNKGDPGNIRYLLLAADLETGAGELLIQPWFTNCSHLLQADLCTDWSEPVKFIVENDGLEKNGLTVSAANEKPYSDNVVEFPAGSLDEEISEAESGA